MRDFDGAISVYFSDINGDGYMDVLGAAILDHDITWWENNDGSGTSRKGNFRRSGNISQNFIGSTAHSCFLRLKHEERSFMAADFSSVEQEKDAGFPKKSGD